MGRPKGKYILFLVEGDTDKEILAGPITEMYEKKYSSGENVIIKFCKLIDDKQSGGDITSKNGVTPQNIEWLIGKLFVSPFLDRNPFVYLREISEVVQIVDLDGSFIDSNRIVECVDKDIVYLDDSIKTKNVNSIICRNKQKADNLRKLIGINQIEIRYQRNTRKVKYSVYFFSCNMDHYIHGDANLSPQDKRRKAEDFSVDCSYVPEYFVDKICDSADTIKNKNYDESWNYIMLDNESLKRHTNLNILVEKLTSSNA